jgi:hypothetical protein
MKNNPFKKLDLKVFFLLYVCFFAVCIIYAFLSYGNLTFNALLNAFLFPIPVAAYIAAGSPKL